jgi:AcrR family transcriptional regulator
VPGTLEERVILRNSVNDTKENILQTALRLFAQDGYEAVSVSEIAVELGMTKGALYKHYKNKRDIFDCIVQRLYDTDLEHSKKFKVPEKNFSEDPSFYQNITISNIAAFTEAQFRFWMEDEFSSNIRKMLTLEQYRNPLMSELYQKVFVSGPVSYMEDVFREMMNQGALPKTNAKLLAIEFCAPFYLLLSLSDVSYNKEELAELFAAHLDKFMKEYFVKE